MNIVSKIRDYYYTLRHLTPTQLYYQLKYRLHKISRLQRIDPVSLTFFELSILAIPSIPTYVKRNDDGIIVQFLNIDETYSDKINWAEMKHGKLWNYHLQYADFLKQDNLPVDFREALILDLYAWLEKGKLTHEPYPASLRIMNVIRFLSHHRVEIEAESDLIQFVYSELHFLEKRLEYHLRGNHLLENAFALLMGGFAFQNENWSQTAEDIFEDQIQEQILMDGAHFERSPMYHLILLFRFLEAFYYLPDDHDLSYLFHSTSKKMLSWISEMSFMNGDLAHFNDSINGQTFNANEIIKLAKVCGIAEKSGIQFSDSGYRKFKNQQFEIIMDACGIAPPSQPGHAHADSLSFILHIHGSPVISDPGISTYEAGDRRNWERSTEAHNTVTFNNQDTADIWGKFRVGRRPHVAIQKESSSEITIHLRHKLKSGDVYNHRRSFVISEKFIEINDDVNLDQPVTGRFHLHPSVSIKNLTKNSVELENDVMITFSNVQKIARFQYEYCEGFNLRKKSNRIEYSFTKQSSIKIETPGI